MYNKPLYTHICARGAIAPTGSIDDGVEHMCGKHVVLCNMLWSGNEFFSFPIMPCLLTCPM